MAKETRVEKKGKPGNGERERAEKNEKKYRENDNDATKSET